MPEEKPPITTMLDLLDLLYLDPLFGDYRKTGAQVQSFQPGEAEVRESFDDGNGHSGAFSASTTSLDWNVFQEALGERFITGILKPGYVSRSEFKITVHGREELFRLRKEAEVAEKTTVGE